MSLGDTHKSRICKAAKLYLLGKAWVSMRRIVILAKENLITQEMKQKTKDKINEIARLMWNSYYSDVPKSACLIIRPHDFSTSTQSGEIKFWNMALVVYVECFSKHKKLLKYKL